MRQALKGIRILDLSRVFAGPGGSMILGDLGADVVRVEAPHGTDSIRDWSPFVKDQSTYYFSANRNKRAITLNLKKTEGRALFQKMVAQADVVLENFKTGTMERLGLGFKQLKQWNPTIILCSVTGYGQTGPFAQEPGFDPVLQAVGGLMDVTGDPDGEATRVGLPVVDMMSSLYTAISILAALRARDLYGEGDHIDISLLDVQVSSLANVASSYLMKGHRSKRMGNTHNNIVPYQVFQCEDKPLMVACGNDQQFVKFCQVVGHPEWAEDSRFKTNASRVDNRNVLTELLDAVMVLKTAETWFALLSDAGVPSGPVNNVEEVFQHPQVQARKMVEKVDHPTLGSVPLVRNPLKFSNMSITIEKHPPLLGEHTETFLQDELGLSVEEIKQLGEEGVI
ncbi:MULTISPECIES: CaiB/BaiF CoA transferase family protein [Virgibacillus]|uniref:Succinyl-CoA:(R)-benzylsuccinate CoA-transferase subunit BbsF n=1 Tax=Virgibacillus massiliensis TaxID=1462526 RepID=A0A024Q7T0_9BACI|nr:CaiB/BaiF CoA-transferase family protein [Virgibacillus massiliensis]CDQ38593.1 Succinyl-CoA:(R)-benzylsuccinate CoA-transferase subunit BbsF [Virgibacillus massiliensis]